MRERTGSGTRLAVPRLLITAGLLIAAVAAVTGLLRSAALLAVLGLLTLALPVSRDLSRRVLVVGTAAFGFVPLLWWVRWPSVFPSHAAVLVVVLAVVLGAGLTGRWVTPAAMVPRVRRTDASGLVGVLLAVWALWPNLLPASGPGALTRMLRGWDHSAHYAMAEMVRVHGSVTTVAADGPLGAWGYEGYPQGYHALVATVVETVVGRGEVPVDQGVALYGRSMAVVSLLAVVVVVAGLCSLPALRRRPLVALGAVLLVTAAFVVGRGALILWDGFPNFFVACAMLAAVPLIVAQMSNVTVPMVAALAGASVAVAQNWALLLVIVAAAVLAVVVPLRRSRWRPVVARRHGRVGLVVVGGLGLVGLGTTAYQLSMQRPLDEILVIGGAISEVSSPQRAVFSAVSVVGAAVLVFWGRRRPLPGRSSPVVVLGLAVPAVGWLAARAIGWVQASSEGSGDYYLVKFRLALLMTLVVVATIVAVSVLDAVVPRREAPVTYMYCWVTSAVAVAPLLALGWPFGATVPAPLRAVGLEPAPVTTTRSWYAADDMSPAPDATIILSAAQAYQDQGDGLVLLLPFPSFGTNPAMTAQWFFALTGTWTVGSQEPVEAGPTPDQDEATAVVYALSVLERHPDLSVMVGPDFYDAVRRGARQSGWDDRVTTW